MIWRRLAFPALPVGCHSLMSVAILFSMQCKAEVADAVPAFVTMVVEQLTSANLCSAALNVC